METGKYLVHLNGNGAASLDGALSSGASGTGVATHIVGGDICHGGVGRRATGALGAVIDAINPELLEGCVGGNVLGKDSREGSDGEGLHDG